MSNFPVFLIYHVLYLRKARILLDHYGSHNAQHKKIYLIVLLKRRKRLYYAFIISFVYQGTYFTEWDLNARVYIMEIIPLVTLYNLKPNLYSRVHSKLLGN